MKDNTKDKMEFVNHLYAYLMKHPELRIGQTISNLAGDKDLFYLEDAELLETLKNH